MKKIINKEILPNGVVVLTMNNPEVNNNITWKAAEDLFLEIKSSRESGSNIFIFVGVINVCSGVISGDRPVGFIRIVK